MQKLQLPAAHRSLRIHTIAAAVLCTVGCATAGAQVRSDAGAAATPETSSAWGLGLGISSAQRPYPGVENKNTAIPLLYYENAWLRVNGGSADIKFANKDFGSNGSLAFAGRLKYEDSGFKADDSPSLTGMDERQGGLWGGAAVTWNHPVVRVSGEWLSDLSSNSKGQKLQLQVDRRFGFGNFAVTPRLQAQWLDKKYVDYYFGVRAHEALPGRSQFTGKAASTLEVGVRMDYMFRPKQTVFVDVSATSLPEEIKSSPIVGRSSVSRVSVGYLYPF